jgi:hypothetical protein
MIRKALIASLLLLVSMQAGASILSVGDSVFGAGSVTRDTTSGLEWLDLTQSLNLSFSDVSIELGVGGNFEGWRYATKLELDTLLFNYTGTASFVSGLTFYDHNSLDGLVDLLGNTIDSFYISKFGVSLDAYHNLLENSYVDQTFGFLSNAYPGNLDLHYLGELYDWGFDPTYLSNQDKFLTTSTYNINDSSGFIGSYLVRTVPEPAVLILFLIGMAGLRFARRKRA